MNQSIFCGTNGDLCLFKMDDNMRFKKGLTCEYLSFPKDYNFYKDDELKIYNSLTCYYHMKFQKSDFDFGVYDFKNNPNSNYYAKTKIFIYLSRLVKIENIFKKYKISMQYPNLFIKFNKKYDNYKKEFIKALKNSGGKNSLNVWPKEIKLHLKIKIRNILKRVLKR